MRRAPPSPQPACGIDKHYEANGNLSPSRWQLGGRENPKALAVCHPHLLVAQATPAPQSASRFETVVRHGLRQELDLPVHRHPVEVDGHLPPRGEVFCQEGVGLLKVALQPETGLPIKPNCAVIAVEEILIVGRPGIPVLAMETAQPLEVGGTRQLGDEVRHRQHADEKFVGLRTKGQVIDIFRHHGALNHGSGILDLLFSETERGTVPGEEFHAAPFMLGAKKRTGTSRFIGHPDVSGVVEKGCGQAHGKTSWGDILQGKAGPVQQPRHGEKGFRNVRKVMVGRITAAVALQLTLVQAPRHVVGLDDEIAFGGAVSKAAEGEDLAQEIVRMVDGQQIG
jgi:hypothetical protein